MNVFISFFQKKKKKKKQGYNQSKYSKVEYSQRRKTSKKESKYRSNLGRTIENRRAFGNGYKNFAWFW